MPGEAIHSKAHSESAVPETNKLEINDLFSVTYEELRRLAASVKRSGPNVTLSPSTLVHEAWIRLAKARGLAPESELHFKRKAAQAMRHVLVEAARRRGADKRGGGPEFFVEFDDSAHTTLSSDRDLLVLHEALEELARSSPRQAALVEFRFFGGSSVAEAAAAIDVSPSTAEREWRSAKAWLTSQVLRGR